MFYNQPLARRFGLELVRHLEDPAWTHLDIAVAWVRASGMTHLREPLRAFLQRGGCLSVVAGIDLQFTSREGLEALLDLEAHGGAETFIHHNEGSGFFHPKLYLFRSGDRARLIVASNNITETGLFVNVEAGLELDVAGDDQVVVDALDALASWKDPTSGFARRLDRDLLAQMLDSGYITDEARTPAVYRYSNTAARPQRLFARRHFSVPPSDLQTAGGEATAIPATEGPVSTTGTVLLMRLRKASKGEVAQLRLRYQSGYTLPFLAA